MSVLVVVVIVGVVAAIAVATLSEPRKPATPEPAHRRAQAPEPPLPPVPPTPPPQVEVAPSTEPEPEPEPEPVWADDPPEFEPAFSTTVASVPNQRRRGERLRSAGLLGLSVAILGGVAAATIGVAALVGYRFLDRALG